MPKGIYNPKGLEHIARENNEIDDGDLNKQLAQKMIIPYYLTNRIRILNIVFNITLYSHHLNHLYSKLTIKPIYLEIEKVYVNNIVKEMPKIYARIINQYKYKYPVVFSARADKQDEDQQVLDEIELHITLSINKNSTESDSHNIDVRSQLEQIQDQESTVVDGDLIKLIR